MSVELNKIAALLEERGYKQGAVMVRDLTKSLLRTGTIPEFLSSTNTDSTESQIKSNVPTEHHQIIAQTKIGPYLNPANLERIAYDTSVEHSKSLKWYTEYLLGQIEDFGEQSIAHLCISPKSTYALSRAGVHTIDGVRKVIQSGGLTVTKNIGFKRAQEVESALNVFDKAVEDDNISKGNSFIDGGGI